MEAESPSRVSMLETIDFLKGLSGSAKIDAIARQPSQGVKRWRSADSAAPPEVPFVDIEASFFFSSPPRFYGVARIKSESYAAAVVAAIRLQLGPRGHTCETAGDLRVTLQTVHGPL